MMVVYWAGRMVQPKVELMVEKKVA